jgi:hypothetical protein
MLLVLIIGLGLAGQAPAARASETSVNDLSMLVWALQNLHDFDLTPNQLQSLKMTATDTADHHEQAPATKPPAKYVAMLNSIRDALAKDDSDQIDELRDDIEEMKEDGGVSIDDTVVVTDAARAKVVGVIKSLSASQIAGYLAQYQDETPDPMRTLMDAAEQAHGADEATFDTVARETGEEIGTLVAGLEAAKTKPVEEKVKAWLALSRPLSDADFKAKRGELEQSARELIAEADPFVVLRHWVERDVAELLSNPQLAAAIDLRLRTPPAPKSD